MVEILELKRVVVPERYRCCCTTHLDADVCRSPRFGESGYATWLVTDPQDLGVAFNPDCVMNVLKRFIREHLMDQVVME